MQNIIIGTGRNCIISCITAQKVITITTGDGIIRITAVNSIRSVLTPQ